MYFRPALKNLLLQSGWIGEVRYWKTSFGLLFGWDRFLILEIVSQINDFEGGTYLLGKKHFFQRVWRWFLVIYFN